MDLRANSSTTATFLLRQIIVLLPASFCCWVGRKKIAGRSYFPSASAEGCHRASRHPIIELGARYSHRCCRSGGKCLHTQNKWVMTGFGKTEVCCHLFIQSKICISKNSDFWRLVWVTLICGPKWFCLNVFLERLKLIYFFTLLLMVVM